MIIQKWNYNFYDGYETADEYLSGNLIKKYLLAKNVNREYSGYFKENVKEDLGFNGTEWSMIAAYEREYLWKGADNTELRLVFNCNSDYTRFNHCEVYIGKTNYDGSLKEGKLIKAPNFVRALVAED